MAINMNRKNPLQNIMMDFSINKVSILNFFCSKQFLKISDYSSYSQFSCTRFGKFQNTAGVNHSRCCAISEIQLSRSHLPEISNFKKLETAALLQLKSLLRLDFSSPVTGVNSYCLL